MQITQDRRRFLTGLTATGAAGLMGAPNLAYAEPLPETTTVRLAKYFPSGCDAPQYLARDLLRAEGFTNVAYVEGISDSSVALARGEIDFDWNYAAVQITSIDAGAPIKVLAGLHSGCLELIASKTINNIKELSGKRVGIYSSAPAHIVLVILLLAYIGLDPNNDVHWITSGDKSPKDLFMEGKVDAFLAGPPETQDLRARKIGHSILNTAVDRPWSQYFCCMLTGHADYVGKYPVATKRVMRALLKAVDMCASNPKSVAQQLVDDKFTDSYDYTLQTLRELGLDRWRDFDPEDTMRFYALRLQETGTIKSSPNSIIADFTDWRCLEELKRELKT
jgi:NitT/TauT family transport system substrate-binding protein